MRSKEKICKFLYKTSLSRKMKKYIHSIVSVTEWKILFSSNFKENYTKTHSRLEEYCSMYKMENTIDKHVRKSAWWWTNTKRGSLIRNHYVVFKSLIFSLYHLSFPFQTCTLFTLLRKGSCSVPQDSSAFLHEWLRSKVVILRNSHFSEYIIFY